MGLESGLQAVHWLLQVLSTVHWKADSLMHWLMMLRELKLAKRFGPKYKQTEALLEKSIALLPDAPSADLPSILHHLLLFGFEVIPAILCDRMDDKRAAGMLSLPISKVLSLSSPKMKRSALHMHA